MEHSIFHLMKIFLPLHSLINIHYLYIGFDWFIVWLVYAVRVIQTDYLYVTCYMNIVAIV